MGFHPAQRHEKQEFFPLLFPERRAKALRVSWSLCDHTHTANGPRHSYMSGALQPSLELIPSRVSVQVWLITLQSHCLPAFLLPNVEGMSFPLDSCHVFHTFDVILFPIVSVHQLAQNCRQKSRAEPQNLQNESTEFLSVILGYALGMKIPISLNRDFNSVYLYVCFLMREWGLL